VSCDVVIPLKTGAPKDYLELRYALRSIEQHFNLLGGGEVYLLGEAAPSWFTGAWVNVGQPAGYSQISGVQFKLKMFADNYAAGEFCFTNDDIYLLKTWAGTRYYNQHRSVSSNFHNVTVQRAKFLLEQNGHAMAHDFELHMPVIFDPSSLRTVLASYDLAIPTALRTLYCNYFPEDHCPSIDCKVMNFMKPDMKWKFFSSDDTWAGREDFKQWLQATFPQKSRWER
jgi:hypothetical protein